MINMLQLLNIFCMGLYKLYIPSHQDSISQRKISIPYWQVLYKFYMEWYKLYKYYQQYNISLHKLLDIKY